MPAFLADENFDRRLLDGLVDQVPGLDLKRVQDVGLSGADDPTILRWASLEGRVLLTHDLRTIPYHMADCMLAGITVKGVVVAPRSLDIGDTLDDLLIIAQCSLPGEWENSIRILPL